jgi:hypothetical protein
VDFSREHLPPESIVGKKAVELLDWVCSTCNGDFSKEDEYFATNYHGAVSRPIQTIIGKKRKGAVVARKDLEVRYRPSINTIQFALKRKPKAGELDAANPDLASREVGQLEIERREVNPRRLGRCLAKMALETVAYLKPQVIQQPELNPIRQYARGRGPLQFLPYALGASKGALGVKLCDIRFEGKAHEVMVALLYLPGVLYAVQLSEHEDLHPLWHVAQWLNLIFDEDGSRTRKVEVLMTMRRPNWGDA